MSDPKARGPLAWMAKNRVAANLLMLLFIVGGLLWAPRVEQEVFPEVSLGLVTVTVAYPGASPREVEEGIVLAVEEAVRGLDGVDEVRSVAAEGMASVVAELSNEADEDQVLSDIKSAVDRITSLPEEAERPIISLQSNRRQVVSLIIHGDARLSALKNAAENARDRLLGDPRITQVEITGIPEPEISIEVPREALRRYGLTLGEIAQRVRAASADVAGGEIDTPSGDVLLRTSEKRERGDEFAAITVIGAADGSQVQLGDIADVDDAFRDSDREAYYNGERAVRVEVFRVGDETPIEVSRAVHELVEETADELPAGLSYAIWNDSSEIFDDRISLLLDNAMLGVLLVVLILGVFLDFRLAFWVTLGIPITFLGAFLFMPTLGVSVNMISLFAFILALGIVVDDAIVVGEAIHDHRERGKPPLEAAIAGAREMKVPLIFAVATTIVAFSPMLFVPGVAGEFFDNIPLIVIPVLVLSLIESFFVLPAHLSHVGGEPRRGGMLGRVRRAKTHFTDGLRWIIDRLYTPLAHRLVHHRYLALAAALGLLAIVGGVVAGGHIAFRFMPEIEGDIASASVRMPFGTAPERTREVMEDMVAAAGAVLEEGGGVDANVRGIYAELGRASALEAGPMTDARTSGGHLAAVAVFFEKPEKRQVDVGAFTDAWRKRVGEVPGADALSYSYDIGPAAAAEVSIQLSHPDERTLRAAASDLAAALSSYAGTVDVDDGFRTGKPQLDLELKPAARALGVTETMLGAQIRSAFFGAEALRQQRGRDELRVYVRLPDRQRESIHDLQELIIRTPRGGEIPLAQAAHVGHGRSFTEIEREGGRRVVDVTAGVTGETTGGEITDAIEQDVLPGLLDRYPGLRYDLSGEQQDQRESLGALASGMRLALLAMFVLMAIAFRSYVQPLVVMFAIPFGVVGAIGGHLLLGYELSLISILGIVALSGVVVNDSLVLIVAVNDFRAEGKSAHDAVVEAGRRRFRPILLTSLTTFFGLAPMIFETSVQARFLIPMAISLGFGVLFVTVIALCIVPAAYLVVEDARRVATRAWHAARDRMRNRDQPHEQSAARD